MINYVIGDATQPIGDGHKFILHVCNNKGGWGAGFVLALSKRWPEPERDYRDWHAGKLSLPFGLGHNQIVTVESDGNPLGNSIRVINMVAQEAYSKPGQPAIRYEALEKCLQGVNRLCISGIFPNVSIHMPRIGCGLAGGKWPEVENIIVNTIDPSIPVNVYDFKG